MYVMYYYVSLTRINTSSEYNVLAAPVISTFHSTTMLAGGSGGLARKAGNKLSDEDYDE